MGMVHRTTSATPESEPRGSLSALSRRWVVLLALLVAAAACGPDTPSGSPSPSGAPRSLPALKLAVLEAVGGRLVYCDPDVYPVAHDGALDNAKRRLPTIRADRETFEAILKHEGLTAGHHFASDELIAINEDYKQMQAIELEPAGSGYLFDLLVPQEGSEIGISRLRGTASATGEVDIQHLEAAGEPNCPICLAAGARIATPFGEIAVQDLRVGTAVWTTDAGGRRIVGVVLETGHMEVPLGHVVVELMLDDDRTVRVSPGHPTADGRTVGALRPGDRYDGGLVTSARLVPYAGSTWDILPSGPTGTYVVNGVLLGSTLGR
jgi:Hint domain-containing protein